MKKFLFILLLLPALAAIGHDLYLFTQNQDKGFRLSDLGKLWDTYHKESHDQWKIKVDELSEIVNDTMGTQTLPQVSTAQTENSITTLHEEFSQKDTTEQSQLLQPAPEKIISSEKAKTTKRIIGFLLEQKAVFVFGAIPAILFILNALIKAIHNGKSSKDEKGSKRNQKKQYKFGRK